ncbi:MAG: 1-acyl-sn-glycerol-3-phosphate acyltransferase [Deltaproteobacteria bacterium]|nr:MAG: 1-acyl-sn-glycerol-3-phosphate acyltransferase [Deltaproteobacteria bacterium]
MDLSLLSELQPAQLRMMLPPFLGQYVAEPSSRDDVVAAMTRTIDGLDDQALGAMLAHMATLGEEYALYDSESGARALTRAWAVQMLGTPEVEGLEHLVEAVEAGPTVVFSNHLSYFDASALDHALVVCGREDLADRLMVAAGPKVYSDLFRRFAAASLATVKVPQSTSLGHTEQMSGRELARRAIASLKAARSGFEEGRFLLIYPEGSRTRTGRMQAWLKAVYRYAELVPCRVVPATLEGLDTVMPVGTMAMRPAPTKLRFGPSFEVGPKEGRQALERAREAVVDMLPEDMRPDDDEPAFV